MLRHHRCTTCTTYVNCNRRNNKKRKLTDHVEDEDCNHPPPAAADVGCGTCDKTVEKELEILRRNVRFLADCHSTAPAESGQADSMVSFVISEGEHFTAHRSILAGVSPVFERMFSLGMLEKETGEVYITDASLSTMEAVVKYCYAADITFCGGLDLDEVTHIAQKYEISSLKDRCETEYCNRFHNSMTITLDLSTAVLITEEVMGIAEKYGMAKLTAACMKELHLRNYIAKKSCEIDRPRKAACSRACHSQTYLTNEKTSPRALANLMRVSFKFGTEGMLDEIYRTFRGLSDEEGKKVCVEVMKFSFDRKN